MNEAAIRALVSRCLADIAPEADLDTVLSGADLRRALDLDSMDFLNLIIALAAATGRDIPEADYPRLFSLTGMATYFA